MFVVITVVEYWELISTPTDAKISNFSTTLAGTYTIYCQVEDLNTLVLQNSNNTLHLQPLIGTTSTTFTENVNCIFSTTLNGANYFYNDKVDNLPLPLP